MPSIARLRPARVGAICLALVVGLIAAPRAAHATDPLLLRRFDELASMLSVMRSRPTSPADPTPFEYLRRLRADVAAMPGALAEIRKLAHPSLQEDKDRYAKLQADLTDTERHVTRAQILLGPIDALAAIDAAHTQQSPAADGALDQADRALADVAQEVGAEPWAAPVLERLRAIAKQLRDADGAIAAAARARFEAQARDERAKAQRAEIADVDERRAELVAHAAAGEPVTDEQVAAVEQRVAKIEASDPDATFSLRLGLVQLHVLQRWQAPDADAPRGLATLFGATLDGKGRTSGKKLEVKLAAAADRCYLLIGAFAAQADTSRVDDFRWELPAGDQVESFHVEGMGGLFQGFCAIKAEKLSARAGLDFEGSKNGVRWAVVSFPRDQFPRDLEAGLVVDRGDHCDPVYWEAIWTRPIPGTIAYDGREPVLLLGPHEIMRLQDPNSLASGGPLSSTPAGTVSFRQHDLEWGEGCPVNDKAWRPALAPASRKLVACYAGLTAKYGSSWERIERQRAAARDAGGIAPAVEDHAVALMKQQDRDAKKCVAIDAAIHAQIEKVNQRLVDRFLETPPVDPAARADHLRRAAAPR